MFKKNKNLKYYILSLIIPFLVFMLISYTLNFNIGSDQNALISDLMGQYSSLISYLRNVLLGKESIFYSFSKGMGGNMLGTIAYYLLSPINLIVIFFSKSNIPIAILFIISLKISLSGLSMFLYLKRSFEESSVLMLIFSSLYALSGYIVVYYFNIMWLDAVYLAPLLMLGIDKIINGEKSLLYGITLFIAIFSNYYMGYMICIYACLYFTYKMLLSYDLKNDKEKIVTSILKFIITSLLAGLMTFIILLPTIYELYYNVGRIGTEAINKYNFILGNIFSRTMIGSHNHKNILNHTTPAIYSGIITVPLVYFYFINKNIDKKERIISLVFLLILLTGLYAPIINKIWHGNGATHSFGFRYSFLITLFIIPLAYKSFLKLKDIAIKHYLIFTIVYFIMSLIVVVQNFQHMSIIFIYISGGLLSIYLLILYNYYKLSRKEINKMKYLLIALVIAELIFNFHLSLRDYEFNYQTEYKGVINTIGKKIKKYNPDNDEFYRIESDYKLSSIDSMLFDHKGVSLFVSTMNSKIQELQRSVGQTTNTNSIKYRAEITPIIDSIFGIKYIMSSNLNYDLKEKFKISSFSGIFYGEGEDDAGVYENKHALELGFMVNESSKDMIRLFADSKLIDNINFQNYILKSMLNSEDDYLKPHKVVDKGEYEYEITTSNDKQSYIFVLHSKFKGTRFNVNILLDNNQFDRLYFNGMGIIKMPNKSPGTYNLSLVTTEDVYGVFAYYFDDEKFNDAIEELKKNQLNIVKYSKNKIKGNINVTKDKEVLFTSIPYEKGWNILVDGKKVDYFSLYEAFIGLDLTEGYHEIEFKFMPPLFVIGSIISGISLILFTLYNLFENKIIQFILNIYIKFEEIINYLIAGGLTTIVSIGSYMIFRDVFSINYILSTIISFVLAVIFAYVVNKIFVFKTGNKDFKDNISEIYQFIKFRLISLVMDILFMIAFVELFKINDKMAKIIVQVIVVIVNYFFSKIFIFKDNGVDIDESTI